MTSPISISVHSFFNGSALHTREQADKLFTAILNDVQPPEEIFVDFSDIEFISRSFADELVNLKLTSREKKLINFCCTNSDVRAMLEAVEHTQTGIQKDRKLPIQRFDNLDNVMNFFSRV
jgi:anti-anti-sigma regulatory factor